MRTTILLLVAALVLLPRETRANEPSSSWEFVGQTEAAASASLRSRVTGFLTQLAVKEGDSVAKGDLLLEVDPRPYRLALDAAQARLQLAKAKLDEAKLQDENAVKLREKQVISPHEVALSKSVLAAAEASLTVAQVEVALAELTLSWTRVTAPFDGRVGRIRAAEGELIIADQTPIVTIVSAEPLRISFSVPETILLDLRRGGTAAPDKLVLAVGYAGEEGFPHAAKLDLIAPEVDPRSGSVKFRGTLSDREGLLSPGMAARVRLTVHRE